MKKRLLALAMASLLAVGSAGATSLIVDGKTVQSDVPPAITDGRTLVPVRALFESLGATVGWDDATQTATATKGGTVISMQIGSQTAYVNGAAASLDVPAQTIDGRTMVPARFVAESLGAQVTWEADTDTVYIATTDNYDGYRLAPQIIYTTSANENGYGDTYMYADGVLSGIRTLDAYDYRVLSTANGNIAILNPFYLSSFYDATSGRTSRVCFMYLGFSEVLNMASGAYMELGELPQDVSSQQPVETPAQDAPVQDTPASTPSNNESRTVYITKTGKRYHYDSNCNGGTYIASTLAEAQARGLTPCQKCVQ